jgi:CRISPR-associated protein Cst2
MIHCLSISGLLTLELHALNNEGAEGNTMMTRMVDIIDRHGRKHTVNAVSGDMFKHILVEHLLGEAGLHGLDLCKGCEVFDANRICSPREDFLRTQGWDAKTLDSVILRGVLRKCTIDDCAGILITGNIGKDRSIARKSCVEFGWVVGRPDATTTDSYFHAKYVPEGRGKGAGEGENVGQNIFHRPASSGRYAVVVNVDLYKVGRNDITLEYDLEGGKSGELRRKRMASLLRSLIHTFVKPTGAHRNTQNPHVVDFEGAIATSVSSIPAPCVSALNADPDYRQEIERIAAALNSLDGDAEAVAIRRFDSLAQFAEQMAAIVREL